MPRVAAVLFDLDGTLVDSAPDLAGTANDMRVQRGLPALPYDRLRPHAGSGARGMLGAAFALRPGAPGYDACRLEFLERYQSRLLQQSAAFGDVLPVLQALSQAALPWGIVTNKALRMAVPLAQGLGLLADGRVLVGGDSTPFIKPHPAPLLEAARRLAVAPEDCLYVGDDERDVQAGLAAGMLTGAAAWGYLGPGADLAAWGAHIVLSRPAALLQFLELA
ncbi:MAG TPA: HAD-IA family hydrolase [Rubrivivax sp.]|nr:HAD-IA family hydrolase [Rubrivivax sp.]